MREKWASVYSASSGTVYKVQVKAAVRTTGPHLGVTVFCFEHEVCKTLGVSLQLGDATAWGRAGQEVSQGGGRKCHRVGQEGEEVSQGGAGSEQWDRNTFL